MLVVKIEKDVAQGKEDEVFLPEAQTAKLNVWGWLVEIWLNKSCLNRFPSYFTSQIQI